MHIVPGPIFEPVIRITSRMTAISESSRRAHAIASRTAQFFY